MPLSLPPKPELATFIQTCTPLAIIPTFEAEMRQRIDAIAQSMLNFSHVEDPADNLARFLRADRDFLGVILSLTNLSQEKFLRIISAERFAQGDFNPEWGTDNIYRKLTSDDVFVQRIAHLFLEGRNSQLLVQQVAAFYLDQLSLPSNWNELIRDTNFIQNIIRRKLSGEYTDKKGNVIEGLIRDKLDIIQETYGITHTKGQVRLVGKEVDHVVPLLDNPFVMIMSSYMETTSSSQTTRANEQSTMYLEINRDNIRYGTKRVLVNFVDGAGWLARRSDLRKLHEGCNYIINLRTLDLLEAIVCKYVPPQYFTRQSRPEVIEG